MMKVRAGAGFFNPHVLLKSAYHSGPGQGSFYRARTVYET